MLIKGDVQLNMIDNIPQSIELIILRVIDDSSARLLVSDRLHNYVNYLWQWQLTHNVVSRKNTIEDIWENVYDSLIFIENKDSVIFSQIKCENNIVDAGAGGGFPSIPLAILFSEKEFQLVDTNRKKCSFLRSVKAQLGLKNMIVVQKNIANIEPTRFMVTKAAFPPSRAGSLAVPLQIGGRLVIWANANTKEGFQKNLSFHNVLLVAEENYHLPGHMARSLLLFRKS